MSRVLLSVRTSADIGSTFGGTTLVSSASTVLVSRLGYSLTKVLVVQDTTAFTTAWTVLRARRGDVLSTFALLPGHGSSQGGAVSVEIELDLEQITGFDLQAGSSEMSVWVYGG